jgi:putative oxidoreductase
MTTTTTTAPLAAPRAGLPIRIALWVAQVLLAALFLQAGWMKAMLPHHELVAAIPPMAEMPLALIRFIGWSELAGAAGLILPALTRIRPGLTPLAAAALALVMVLAAGFHGMRGEWSGVVTNLVILAMTLFVAWGRTRRAPIAPR